jgi:hypothetical protein
MPLTQEEQVKIKTLIAEVQPFIITDPNAMQIDTGLAQKSFFVNDPKSVGASNFAEKIDEAIASINDKQSSTVQMLLDVKAAMLLVEKQLPDTVNFIKDSNAKFLESPSKTKLVEEFKALISKSLDKDIDLNNSRTEVFNVISTNPMMSSDKKALEDNFNFARELVQSSIPGVSGTLDESLKAEFTTLSKNKDGLTANVSWFEALPSVQKKLLADNAQKISDGKLVPSDKLIKQMIYKDVQSYLSFKPNFFQKLVHRITGKGKIGQLKEKANIALNGRIDSVAKSLKQEVSNKDASNTLFAKKKAENYNLANDAQQSITTTDSNSVAATLADQKATNITAEVALQASKLAPNIATSQGPDQTSNPQRRENSNSGLGK